EIEPAAALAEASQEAEPEVERVVFAAEPSRVVFMTPSVEPGIPEISSLTLPEPEPVPVVVEEPPMEPAPAEFLAPEIEPAAALAAAPQEVEPEVERVVFAAEPATELAAAEPSRVVFVTPLAAPGIPEISSLTLPEPEPAPAEFPAPEIELAAALAAARQTEIKSIPQAGEPEPRISISSGLVVRREPAREAGPKLVRPVAKLPKGFFEAAEIATLIDQDQSLTGVVVAIGINDYQRALQSQSKGDAQELAGSVDRLIRSLISANDFAYRRAAGEFIVVFPNEKGAAAQNRIHQVTERLWDYQLRALAAFSVLFSWGAVTVDEESFSEAVAFAADEMSETRDSRRGFGMEAIRTRRRAVSF
ncbi:MAG: hypothetical protein NT090_19205, partial [Acidobacteria bacterium]|nr:hypothetical protein [Acidobacteriota bacterium]